MYIPIDDAVIHVLIGRVYPSLDIFIENAAKPLTTIIESWMQ